MIKIYDNWRRMFLKWWRSLLKTFWWEGGRCLQLAATDSCEWRHINGDTFDSWRPNSSNFCCRGVLLSGPSSDKCPWILPDGGSARMYACACVMSQRTNQVEEKKKTKLQWAWGQHEQYSRSTDHGHEKNRMRATTNWPQEQHKTNRTTFKVVAIKKKKKKKTKTKTTNASISRRLIVKLIWSRDFLGSFKVMAHILDVILYQSNCVWFLHVNICYCDVVISQLVRVNAEVCNFRTKNCLCSMLGTKRHAAGG